MKQKRCTELQIPHSYSQRLEHIKQYRCRSLIELASLYTVPLNAVNGLSRLTTTSNGQTQPIRKFLNRSITVESNRNGQFEFKSNLEASQVPILHLPSSAFVVFVACFHRTVGLCGSNYRPRLEM